MGIVKIRGISNLGNVIVYTIEKDKIIYKWLNDLRKHLGLSERDSDTTNGEEMQFDTEKTDYYSFEVEEKGYFIEYFSGKDFVILLIKSDNAGNIDKARAWINDHSDWGKK